MATNPPLTDKELLRKFFRRYPVLRPTKAMEPSLHSQAIQAFQKSNFDYHLPTLFVSPFDLSKFCFSMALSKLEQSPSFYHLSLGQLLNIWLGNSEEYKSFEDVNSHAVGLYWGFGDLPNKESGTSIENAVKVSHSKNVLQITNAFGKRQVTGQVLWLYYRGTGDELIKRYPTLLPSLLSYDYQIMTIGTHIPKSPVVEASESNSALF